MIKNDIVTEVSAVKLPWRVKIGYSLGNMAKALLAVTNSMFLIYFYVNVCGIRSEIAATITLIAKIWDIINDPMMGAVVDRTVSNAGKCRFYLKYFSLPAGIVFALSYFCPNFAMPGKIAWVAVTYIFQGMFSTILLIPLNTLMGRLTSDAQQRMHINQLNTGFSLVGSYLVQATAMSSVLFLGGDDMGKGFARLGMIYGALYIVLHLIVFWATKGYEPLEHLSSHNKYSANVRHSEKQPLSVALKALAKNRMLMLAMGAFFLVNISLSMEMAAFPFYIQYNKGSDTSLYTLYSNINSISALIVILTASLITKKLGIARTAAAGAALTSVGYFFRFFLHDGNSTIMAIGWILIYFSGAFISCTIMLLIFESKVYGIWKTGVTNEAILMSGYSVAYKVGMALGSTLLGYLLPLFHFSEGAATQPIESMNFLFLCCTLIPGIIFVGVSILLVCFTRYEKQLPMMEAEIKARNVQ